MRQHVIPLPHPRFRHGMIDAMATSRVSKTAMKDILARLHQEERPSRVPFSLRFPRLKPAVLFARQTLTTLKHAANRSIARTKSSKSLPHRLHKHSSLLLRKLGASDMRLQRNKVQNLKVAIAEIDGIVIRPGETFSLWTLVGKPTKKRGFVDGMLLSRGLVLGGLGGGLCQLANLLHWLFLHAPVEIVERYHHSLDVFPDSGRTVPFGSGATILYNFVDLKVKNTSHAPIQVRLWMTNEKLWGEVRTDDPRLDAYRVQETDHCFVHDGTRWFRYNRLWRVSRGKNRRLQSTLALTNFAPVLYKVDPVKLRDAGNCVLEVPQA